MRRVRMCLDAPLASCGVCASDTAAVDRVDLALSSRCSAVRGAVLQALLRRLAAPTTSSACAAGLAEHPVMPCTLASLLTRRLALSHDAATQQLLFRSLSELTSHCGLAPWASTPDGAAVATAAFSTLRGSRDASLRLSALSLLSKQRGGLRSVARAGDLRCLLDALEAASHPTRPEEERGIVARVLTVPGVLTPEACTAQIDVPLRGMERKTRCIVGDADTVSDAGVGHASPATGFYTATWAVCLRLLEDEDADVRAAAAEATHAAMPDADTAPQLCLTLTVSRVLPVLTRRWSAAQRSRRDASWLGWPEHLCQVIWAPPTAVQRRPHHSSGADIFDREEANRHEEPLWLAQLAAVELRAIVLTDAPAEAALTPVRSSVCGWADAALLHLLLFKQQAQASAVAPAGVAHGRDQDEEMRLWMALDVAAALAVACQAGEGGVSAEWCARMREGMCRVASLGLPTALHVSAVCGGALRRAGIEHAMVDVGLPPSFLLHP